MNTAMAPRVFNHLFNGSLINKTLHESGMKVANPMFNEVFTNLEAYQQQYRLLGYELVMAGESYFIRELGEVDQFRDVSMKVQVLFEVLARGVTQIPLHVSALFDVKAGVSRPELQAMMDDEVGDILKACEMKGSLEQEVTNILVGRGIAFWNEKDALVLTEGGAYLFDTLFGQSELDVSTAE